MAKRRYPHPETSCRRVKGSLNLSLLNRLEQSPIGARPSTGTRKPEGGVRHESGPRQARHCCENQIIISFHSAANNSYFCLFFANSPPRVTIVTALFSFLRPSPPRPLLYFLKFFSLWFSPNFLPPSSVPDSPLSLHSRGSPASFPWLRSLPNFVAFILFYFSFFALFFFQEKENTFFFFFNSRPTSRFFFLPPPSFFLLFDLRTYTRLSLARFTPSNESSWSISRIVDAKQKLASNLP